MNRKFLQISLLALIWFVIFSCSEEKEQAKNSAAALNAEEQKVVDYLLADWNKQFRSTSIPLAMKNLDLQPDDDFRLNIARYFRKHTDLANNLKWWGVNNYLLSNDEKLIAKYLINQYDQEQRLPDLTTLAEAVDLTETVVNAKLNFLVR
ncbi:MAG: hypothetical protein ACE5HS_20675, partial [bacterium]